MKLTEHERYALLMLSYAANGAATCSPAESPVLQTVAATIAALLQRDPEYAANLMRDLATMEHVAAQPVTTGRCRDCGSGIGYPHHDYCTGVSWVAPVPLVAPKDCDVKS